MKNKLIEIGNKLNNIINNSNEYTKHEVKNAREALVLLSEIITELNSEKLEERVAQSIRIVNLDYIIDQNNPQETLAGSRHLASTVIDVICGNK